MKATVQAPVKVRVEGILVPVSLGGEGFKLGDMLVDVVGFLHLKECEPFLNNMPVLRISKAGPELVPEVGCSVMCGFQRNPDVARDGRSGVGNASS